MPDRRAHHRTAADRGAADRTAADRTAADRRAPDRYCDAVHARRTELLARRVALLGGHRNELRSCLALSRLTTAAAAEVALADLAHEARAHIEGADRTARDRLPALLAGAVEDVTRALDAQWAVLVRPSLRRMASERALQLDPGWDRLPPPAPPEHGRSQPVATSRSTLAELADGAALGRLAVLPLAALPVLGLPAWGGPALAPLAVGTGVVAFAVAVRSRRAAIGRARLRHHVEEVLAAVRRAIEVDLGRRALELERTAGAALDSAVLRRRAEVEVELARLGPDRTVAVSGA